MEFRSRGARVIELLDRSVSPIRRACSPERAAWLDEMRDELGAGYAWKILPLHVLDALRERRLEGAFAGIVTVAVVVTGAMSILQADLLGAAIAGSLACFACCLTYFESSRRRHRSWVLAGGAVVLGTVSAVAAVRYRIDGPGHRALRIGLGVQAAGLLGLAMSSVARHGHAARVATGLAVGGTVVCGIADALAAVAAWRAGDVLEAMMLAGILPLALAAAWTVPRFDTLDALR